MLHDAETWSESPKVEVPKGIPGWAFWFRGGIAGNGVFIFTGNANADQKTWWCITTRDGKTIDSFAVDLPPVNSLAFGGGTFLLVSGNALYTTKDGRAWHKEPAAPADKFRQAVYTGSEFFLSGEKGVYTSADGISWKTFGKPIPCERELVERLALYRHQLARKIVDLDRRPEVDPRRSTQAGTGHQSDRVRRGGRERVRFGLRDLQFRPGQGVIGGPKVAQAGIHHPQAADEDEIDSRRGVGTELLPHGVDHARHGRQAANFGFRGLAVEIAEEDRRLGQRSRSIVCRSCRRRVKSSLRATWVKSTLIVAGLPSQANVNRVAITAAVIDGQGDPLPEFDRQRRQQAVAEIDVLPIARGRGKKPLHAQSPAQGRRLVLALHNRGPWTSLRAAKSRSFRQSATRPTSRRPSAPVQPWMLKTPTRKESRGGPAVAAAWPSIIVPLAGPVGCGRDASQTRPATADNKTRLEIRRWRVRIKRRILNFMAFAASQSSECNCPST